MKNKTEPWERQIEEILEKVTAHPIFLKSVSALLNASSYQKIWLRSIIHSTLRALDLPNKLEQEQTLYLVHELQHRILDLEKQLQNAETKNQGPTAQARVRVSGQALQ